MFPGVMLRPCGVSVRSARVKTWTRYRAGAPADTDYRVHPVGAYFRELRWLRTFSCRTAELRQPNFSCRRHIDPRTLAQVTVYASIYARLRPPGGERSTTHFCAALRRSAYASNDVARLYAGMRRRRDAIHNATCVRKKSEGK